MSYEAWGEPDEGPTCVDCGCELSPESDPPRRCDTCQKHVDEECDDDCPVVCGACEKHHFDGDACVGDPPKDRL